MKSKYRPNAIVFEKMFPGERLIVTRYAHELYHCLTDEGRRSNILLCFEKELTI
jgi:hypothetical protein